MLFIPITEITLSKFSDSPSNLQTAVDNLSLVELCSILLIQQLPDPLSVSDDEKLLVQVERLIAQSIVEYAKFPLEELKAFLVDDFNENTFSEGLKSLEQLPIQCMSLEQLLGQKYLQNDGTWNWQFRHDESTTFVASRCLNSKGVDQQLTTTEEERLLSIILSDLDEPIDVQGYAGTGKTWIITQLVDVLKRENAVFLAETVPQAKALTDRINDVRADTFSNIAEAFLESDQHGSVRKISVRSRNNAKRYSLSYIKMAEFIGVHNLGEHSKEFLVSCAWRSIRKFCHTDAPEIMLSHVRAQFGVSSVEQQFILTLAIKMWELICIPQDGIFLPITKYHMVKAHALTGVGIPSKYSYIVVDEKHNLPSPITQILENSQQPVFAFGDYYQALRGTEVKYRQASSTLRRKSLSHSIRAGSNIENTYNKILYRHAIEPEVEFSGNRSKVTKQVLYDSYKTPDDFCAILAKGVWAAFIAAWQLYKENQRYHLLSRTKNEIKSLIGGAINLSNGDRASHPYLRNQYSWQSFVEKSKEYNEGEHQALSWVNRLIQEGFNHQDLAVILSKSVESGTNLNSSYPMSAYVVGRIEDCRNVEFERVLLLDDITEGGNKEQASSYIYTGVSRARDVLYIPESVIAWLDGF